MHVHSLFSDGTCSVEEIVSIARRRHVSILALTDHDTIDGLDAFCSACEKYSIRPITGIELSAASTEVVHILGYRIKDLPVLRKSLDRILRCRQERNARICQRLEKLGLAVSMEDLEKEAGGGVIARPHFARVMVSKGYSPDIRSAFSAYLADGAPAYVPRTGCSPSECVKMIIEAGGLPVLAHPSLTGLDADKMDLLLEDLKEAGLWGLECLSSHCSAEEAFYYLRMAERHTLFPTAGSDFHGANRPNAILGVQVSESFLPWARLGISR